MVVKLKQQQQWQSCHSCNNNQCPSKRRIGRWVVDLMLMFVGLELLHPIFPNGDNLNGYLQAEGESYASQTDKKTTNHTNKNLCTRSQLRRGQWVPVRYDKTPYYPTADTCLEVGNNPLVNRNSTNGTTTSWDTYEWKPSDESCLFPSWSDDGFCKLVSGKTIMFVGDSIMREQYSALVHRFGWTGTKFQIFEYAEHKICSDSTRVLFKKDYSLLVFGKFLTNYQPEIVVFNRGIHYEPNDDVLRSQLAQNLDDLKNRSRGPACTEDVKNGTAEGTKCVAIWKTSVPGHPRCHTFTKPVNNITEMELLVANKSLYNSESDYENWGWNNQKRQNEKVLQQIQTWNQEMVHQQQHEIGSTFHPLVPLDIIDAYDMLILRPDLHLVKQKDCVHSCAPGKTEILNQLLFQILRAKSNGESYADTHL